MEVKHENMGTVNKNRVTLQKGDRELTMVFSYGTCVSLHYMGRDRLGILEGVRATHQNDWSTTTGKLLNQLEPDKAARLPADKFNAELTRAFALFESETFAENLAKQ